MVNYLHCYFLAECHYFLCTLKSTAIECFSCKLFPVQANFFIDLISKVYTFLIGFPKISKKILSTISMSGN